MAKTVPGWRPMGGTSRNFINDKTGEILSRRQFDKMAGRIVGSYEAKSKKNKQEDLAKSLSRAARGRTKATSQQEIEQRLENAALQEENKRVNKLNKKAQSKAKRVTVKKIRPQLLKSGHRAARIPFNDYGDYVDLMEQANEQRAPGGRRLITSYGFGITGFDERTGNEIDATLVTLQSPRVIMDEYDFAQITYDFIMEHPYFIFSHYWLHLQFDIAYAEQRAAKARKKNSPLGRR